MRGIVYGNSHSCAYRELNSDVLMVQTSKNWAGNDASSFGDSACDWRILFQRQVRAYLIVIFQVRHQYVTEMALAEHNNVVKAFPADRTDQPFSICILPWGTRRCRTIANAYCRSFRMKTSP